MPIVQKVLDAKSKIDVLQEQSHVGCCQIDIDLVVDIRVDRIAGSGFLFVDCSLTPKVAELPKEREVIEKFDVKARVHRIAW